METVHTSRQDAFDGMMVRIGQLLHESAQDLAALRAASAQKKSSNHVSVILFDRA